MTAHEVGQKLVDLCKQGKAMEAIETLYSKDIVSVEAMTPPGGSRETAGLDGVMGKSKWWMDNHEVHSAKYEGPIAADAHFCVRMTYDITNKPSGRRMTMDELGVYQVKDGKIIREEFFYPV